MSRRLSMLKKCAVCADEFRPLHKDQPTCSRTCGGIRNARLQPKHYAMQAANAARRQQFAERLAQSLEGLSLVDAYRRGELRGYRTAHQKFSRQLRKVA